MLCCDLLCSVLFVFLLQRSRILPHVQAIGTHQLDCATGKLAVPLPSGEVSFESARGPGVTEEASKSSTLLSSSSLPEPTLVHLEQQHKKKHKKKVVLLKPNLKQDENAAEVVEKENHSASMTGKRPRSGSSCQEDNGEGNNVDDFTELDPKIRLVRSKGNYFVFYFWNC